MKKLISKLIGFVLVISVMLNSVFSVALAAPMETEDENGETIDADQDDSVVIDEDSDNDLGGESTTVDDSSSELSSEEQNSATDLSSEYDSEEVEEVGEEHLVGETNGTCGESLTWRIVEDELIISGTGDMWDYTYSGSGRAPWREKTFSKLEIEEGVKSIGEYAFCGCTGLTELQFTNGLRLKEHCFEQCTGLTEIELSDGMHIGSGAFAGCEELTKVVFGSVASIGNSAFSNCSNIENIVLPKTLSIGVLKSVSSSKLKTAGPIGSDCNIEFGWTESFPQNAFYGQSSLESIVMPDSITSIGECAFYACTGLTEIELPKGLVSIGFRAFYDCTGLAKIVSSGNPIIGDAAFGGCSNIEKVIFSDDGSASILKGISSTKLRTAGPIGSDCNIEFGWTESFPQNAFYGQSNLVSVTIPNSVTSIGENAFNCCTSLEEIDLPTGLTSIGAEALSGCTGLTEIDLPTGLTSIGAGAFSGCTGLTEIDLPDGVTNIDQYTFVGCTGLREILFPNGLTSIGFDAFRNCTGLNKVVFSGSISSIYDTAFDGCSHINKIILPKTLSIGVLKSVSSSLLKTAGPIGSGCNIEFGWDETIPENAFYGQNSLESITIPEGVTSIGGYAFSGCVKLTEIKLPSSLTGIGQYAFQDCKVLKKLEIPNTVATVGYMAFQNCTYLEKVTIPRCCHDFSSDYSYGYIFSGCKMLKTAGPIGSGCNIEFDWDEIIPSYAFRGASFLESVIIPQGITIIDMHAFHGCTKLSNVLVPSSLTTIEYAAFLGCKSLTEIDLPDSILSIAGEAFSGCENMQSVELPVKVIEVSDSLFNGCKGLRDITLSDNTTTIGRNAFQGCISLESVVIPNKTVSICESAFKNCSKISTITLPDGLSGIGDDVFCNCTSLSEISLPLSLSTINASLFAGCNNLKTITIPFGVKNISDYAFDQCVALTNVYYGGREAEWNKITVGVYNANLKNATKHYSENYGSGYCYSDFVYDSYDYYWEVDKDGVMRINGSGHIFTPYLYDIKDSIIRIELSEGMTSIDSTAFGDLENLISISIPFSMISIGSDAFKDCVSLQNIDYPGTKSQWDKLSKYNSVLKQLSVNYSLAVIFEAKGGIVDVSSKSITKGRVYGALPVPKERIGYTFKGWYLSEGGNDRVTETTVVTKDETHKLYAHWEAFATTVAFDPNGGAVDTETKNVSYGSVYGDLPLPTWVGKDFVGWFTLPDKGTQVTEESVVSILEPQTLYAHWADSRYTVSFVVYDNVVLTTKKLGYNAAYGNLPEPTIRPGYTFIGWFMDLAGNDEVTADTVVTITADHSLYAHWSPNEYEVSFDANGGSVDSDFITVTFGQKYGSMPIPECGELFFRGWFTEAEGGDYISTDSLVAIPRNHTLYAHWATEASMGIKLDYSTLAICTGTQKTLKATVYPTTLDQEVEWRVLDENVATVSNGIIVGIAPGRTFVKASTVDRLFTASCEVIVTSSDVPYESGAPDNFDVPKGLWATGFDSKYVYTGAKITPALRVYYGNTLLREKQEYTVSYKNNQNAGQATIIIKGKGAFTGKCTTSFEILPESIEDSDVDIAPGVANGARAINPAVTVTHKGIKLKKNKDYRLYYYQIYGEGSTEVTVAGMGNYSGDIKKTFIVKARKSPSLKNATLTGLAKKYSVDSIQYLIDSPESLGVKLGKKVLPKSEYILKFENCDRVGKGTIVVQPTSDSIYVGEKRVMVNIAGTKLGSLVIAESNTYNGEKQLPIVSVYTGKKGTGALVPESCYDLTYSSSLVNAGTITVTVKAKTTTGYFGKVTGKYKIMQRNINDADITITMPSEIYYSNGGTTPVPLINYFNGSKTWTLRDGIDYTISYTNNKMASGSKMPTYTIKGKGNFKGKTEAKAFTINKRDISTLAMDCSDIKANSKKKGSYYCTKPVIIDVNGKALKINVDYTVAYTNLTTGKVIGKTDVLPAGTKIKADITAKEKNYTGKAELIYEVLDAVRPLKSVKIGKIVNQAYTGGPVEISDLSVKYVVGNGKNKIETPLVKGEDYVVTAYYNNVKKGTASLRIEGRGEYCGSRIITFKIVAANNKNIWKGVYRK